VQESARKKKNFMLSREKGSEHCIKILWAKEEFLIS
jgi:hypothetical protein